MQTENKYSIGQSSRIDTDKEKYYRWSIWINEDQAVLDNINYVEYILHPSFKTRVRKIGNRHSKFKLNASGWGEFMINLKIHEVPGEIIRQQYWLTLDTNYENVQQKQDQEISDHKPKTVFFSYSTYDSDFAKLLLNDLKNQGIKVITTNDAPHGESWIDFLQQTISNAHALVTVIPPYENSWQKEEIDIADAASVPVIPVSFSKIGEGSIASMTNAKILRSDSENMIGNLGKEISNKLFV